MPAPLSIPSPFSGGQVQDIEPHLAPAGTYRLSENGTIAAEGQADAWSPAAGSSPLVTPLQNAPEDGLLCGAIPTTGNSAVLFYRRINAPAAYDHDEIGLFNGATYTTLWSSFNDPSGYRLNLEATAPVRGFYLEESPAQKNVYFHVPGRSQPMVINLAPGGGARRGHALSLQPDCRFPRVRFSRRLDASPLPGPGQSDATPASARPTYLDAGATPTGAAPALKAGVYRLMVRYRTDSHLSPPCLPSEPVFVTARPLDAAAALNPFRRSMSASGTLAAEGIAWSLTDLDTRWPEAELIYLYYPTPAGAAEARVFGRIAVPPTGTAEVRLTSNNGTPLDVEALIRRDTTVLSCRTMTAVKNTLLLGGPRQVPPPTVDARFLTVTTRPLTIETDIIPLTMPLFTPATPTPQNPLGIEPTSRPMLPARVSEEWFIQDYQPQTGPPVTRSVKITNDFASWRGQAVWSALRGYFGGENVGLGLLPFDAKGHPLAVQPLGEYVVPARGSAAAPLSQPTLGGRHAAVTIGLRLGGIRIRKDTLATPGGGLLIGGLAVVRRPSAPGRRGRPMHQGVLLPVVQTNGASDGWRQPPALFPSPSVTTAYQAAYAAVGSPGGHASGPATDNVLLAGSPSQGAVTTLTVPGWATYHSPEVMTSGEFAHQVGDFIRVATVARNATGENASPLGGGVSESQFHVIHRLYRSDHDTLTAPAGRPLPGDSSRVALGAIFPTEKEKALEKFDPDKAGRKAYPNIDTSYKTAGIKYSLVERGAVLLKVPDFESVDATGHAGPRAAYLASYYRPDTEAEPSLAQTQDWIPTGHFLPLTEALINSLPHETTTDGVVWVTLSGVDVFGGDCVTQMVDLATHAPYWGEIDRDYGEGLIVPMECSVNLELRTGRRLAESGLYPEKAARGQANLSHLTGGISDTQPENWDVADVLRFREDVAIFNSLPPDMPVVSDRPASVAHSLKKTYGQREDAFRRFLPFNARDLEGQHGPITTAFECFDQLYFTQAHAFGILPVAERSLVPSSSGAIVAGTGADVGEARYVSRLYGCQHPRAATCSDRAYYFLDASKGVWLRHTQAGLDELSETRGLSATLRAACRALPAAAAADMGLEEARGRVWLALGGRAYLYDERRDRFLGHLPVQPRWLVPIGPSLTAPSPAADEVLWRLDGGPLGSWFGTSYGARLQFVVPVAARCQFDNARLLGDHPALAGLGAGCAVRYWTDEDPTRVVTLQPWRAGEWVSLAGGQWQYPLMTPQEAMAPEPRRLQGRLLYVEIVFQPNPAGLPPVALTAHRTDARPALRP